jgi:branched-chain amino acid transport system permease protein
MSTLKVRKLVAGVLIGIVLVLAILAPYLTTTTGGILPNELNSPGSLQVLAVIFTVAALATSFDLLVGYTGLFSFGHALFFAIGSYAFAMTLTLTHAGFATSVVVGVLVTIVGAVIVNAVALRASLIAFSMVTLAFAQLASIIVNRNYFSTGGEEGITLPYQRMPDIFVGIVNTRYTYWVALGLLVFVIAVVSWVTRTRTGRVWQAIRENELRVSVMGLNVYLYKLTAAVIGSTLAGIAGIVYAIVLGTADPSVTGLFYSLGLIVMVILGGRGRVWGAVLGGILYALMQQRLPALAGSDAISGLPKVLRIPLSDPELLLGVVFIVFIFVLPGGLADLVSRLFHRGLKDDKPDPPAEAVAAATDAPDELAVTR